MSSRQSSIDLCVKQFQGFVEFTGRAGIMERKTGEDTGDAGAGGGGVTGLSGGGAWTGGGAGCTVLVVNMVSTRAPA
jgi:hypothetical protein